MPAHSPAVWIGFTVLVVGLLALDLGVLNRRAHVAQHARGGDLERQHRRDRARSSAASSGGARASRSALEYYTGYLIELSLSVDNLFVFILIFQYFAVPAELQPRVLKWGIIGAIVMRGVMIALGALLLRGSAGSSTSSAPS